MLSHIYSPSKNEDGFTLIELLIVVIIIGILAAIALPIFLNQQKAAADASVQSDVRNTVDNIATWLTNSSNQNKAEANTGAFTTDGGKAVISGSNTVGVAIATDGSYTVCAYGSSNSKYTSSSAAYTYDSKSGNFGTGSCASGSDTGGSAAGSGGAVVTPVVNYDFSDGTTQGWTTSVGTLSATTFNGKTALHLVGSTSASNAIQPISPTFNLAAGTYTLSADVYIASITPSAGSPFTRVTANSSYTTNVTTVGSWQHTTSTFTASGPVSGAKFTWQVISAASAGTTSTFDAYVTNVQIVKN